MSQNAFQKATDSMRSHMYSFTSRVRYSEIGQDGRLTIPALVDYLQDCTTFGSEELGLGPAHTAKTRALPAAERLGD